MESSVFTTREAMGVLNVVISLLSSPRYKPGSEVHILLKLLMEFVKVLDEIKGSLA
jgi:hypothetical protein